MTSELNADFDIFDDEEREEYDNFLACTLTLTRIDDLEFNERGKLAQLEHSARNDMENSIRRHPALLFKQIRGLNFLRSVGERTAHPSREFRKRSRDVLNPESVEEEQTLRLAQCLDVNPQVLYDLLMCAYADRGKFKVNTATGKQTDHAFRNNRLVERCYATQARAWDPIIQSLDAKAPQHSVEVLHRNWNPEFQRKLAHLVTETAELCDYLLKVQSSVTTLAQWVILTDRVSDQDEEAVVDPAVIPLPHSTGEPCGGYWTMQWTPNRKTGRRPDAKVVAAELLSNAKTHIELQSVTKEI